MRTFTVQDRREYSSSAIPPKPWWQKEYFGVPLWMWLTVAGGIAVIGGTAYYVRKRAG